MPVASTCILPAPFDYHQVFFSYNRLHWLSDKMCSYDNSKSSIYAEKNKITVTAIFNFNLIAMGGSGPTFLALLRMDFLCVTSFGKEVKLKAGDDYLVIDHDRYQHVVLYFFRLIGIFYKGLFNSISI